MTRWSLLVLTAFIACSPRIETGPGEVRWDRDICVRCTMVLSDHFFTAQIRGGEEGRRTKLYFFDDIGCAILWLDQQEWKEDPRTEIWIPDYRSGEWMEARSVWYKTGLVTPMDYGLGALPGKAEGLLDFDQALEVIYQRDKRNH